MQQILEKEFDKDKDEENSVIRSIQIQRISGEIVPTE